MLLFYIIVLCLFILLFIAFSVHNIRPHDICACARRRAPPCAICERAATLCDVTHLKKGGAESAKSLPRNDGRPSRVISGISGRG